IWDLTTGTLLRELNQKEFQSGTDALVFSPTGDLLATGGSQTVQLWDVASGRSVVVCQGHSPGNLTGVVMSPDRARLATGSGREVKLWDAKSGQEALTLSLPEPRSGDRPGRIAALAWSAGGRRLRAALDNGTVIEWDGTPRSSK